MWDHSLFSQGAAELNIRKIYQKPDRQAIKTPSISHQNLTDKPPNSHRQVAQCPSAGVQRSSDRTLSRTHPSSSRARPPVQRVCCRRCRDRRHEQIIITIIIITARGKIVVRKYDPAVRLSDNQPLVSDEVCRVEPRGCPERWCFHAGQSGLDNVGAGGVEEEG